jgi:hypothetical protein
VSLRAVTIACFILGVALMIPFEAALTRVLGVACLAAFVVCGTFLVASPDFLEGDGD